jgi:pantetheine-phosphate adenylyltransferase
MSKEKETPAAASGLTGAFRRAVYPGSFSPMTRGHHDIILQAARSFDELYIAIGINHQKQPMFSDQERLAMIEDDIKNHLAPALQKAGVKCTLKAAIYDGTTARFMEAANAPYYVRGLRVGMDFDHEIPGIVVSKSIYPGFTPVFFCSTDPKLQNVSSSVAREVCRFGEDALLETYVTPNTKEKMIEKMAALKMRPAAK